MNWTACVQLSLIANANGMTGRLAEPITCRYCRLIFPPGTSIMVYRVYPTRTDVEVDGKGIHRIKQRPRLICEST